MKVLVIGSGGREHALVWKISQSPLVKKVFAAPGNAGIEELAECRQIQPTDFDKLLHLAKSQKIDLTVVGPEAPLVKGIVDLFQKNDLRIFGPSKGAARLEGSKVFSKQRMREYKVPTASYEVFSSANEAQKYVTDRKPPFVVKADGLAAGKGVTVAMTHEEASKAITDALENKIFGEAGNQVVVEEFLQGEELSILAFTDGKKVLPLASSQDHKKAFDNDEGPNTGGMGAYSPCPFADEDGTETLVDKTIRPLIEGLRKEGVEYRGLIYAGLMLTEKGPFVLEYNVRFGDPEAEAVIPRLDEDIVPILLEVADGKLSRNKLRWKCQASVTVVLASQGYPGHYSNGFPVTGLEKFSNKKDILIFHAGTKKDASKGVVTAGGRVLDVTALGSSLQEARYKVYGAVTEIHFQGCFFRKDIGWRALTKVS